MESRTSSKAIPPPTVSPPTEIQSPTDKIQSPTTNKIQALKHPTPAFLQRKNSGLEYDEVHKNGTTYYICRSASSYDPSNR